jgi:hypothetical protein
MSDYRRGLGLEIGFIDHFNTRLMTALNYSAITDLHSAHAKSFQSSVTSRSPVTMEIPLPLSTAPTKSSLHRLHPFSLPYNSDELADPSQV